jgi:pimeloyl-ACP methyl ester carboxylesterase
MPTRTLTTPFADIAVLESAGAGPAVLMLHGNSSCKEIFARQFDSPLAGRFRLIAIDLPGHGASSNARDPATGYVLSVYAACVVDVLEQLGVTRAAVLGWSLGGHIALDLISRFTGVMISGTPPVPGSPEGAVLGFQQNEHMALSSTRAWSDADAEAYARTTAGPNAPFEPFMLAAARRTHDVAREIFFADALSGKVDQRRTAETARTPLAIVNGADDAFLNAGYFDTLRYANLWDGKVHRLPGVGHAPFWEAPALFNPLLERFVEETGG